MVCLISRVNLPWVVGGPSAPEQWRILVIVEFQEVYHDTASSLLNATKRLAAWLEKVDIPQK